jgi:hypothetical protein
LSDDRRPTIGRDASGISIATRATGWPQSFRDEASNAAASGRKLTRA